MINNDINAGNFVYCMTHWAPHQSKEFYNSGNGFYHQYTYLVDGSCTVDFRDVSGGSIVRSIDSRNINRLFSHANTPKYETINSTEEGVTLMFFNPISEDRKINVEIKNAGTHNIVATDKRITIVSIIGPVTANNKELITMQHAAVFPGKSAELVIPENGICALVSYA
jgi:hypothetical protein